MILACTTTTITTKNSSKIMDIKNDIMVIKESAGKGLGAYADEFIKEGQSIISEKPAVIGPKQTSPFVCVDCFDYINEQTVNPCRLCGLPLCPDCAKMGSPKYHGIECKLFETCGMYKSNPVTTYKQAKTIYMYLTPLRLLLKSENNPELMKLSSKLEDRENTLIYFLNAAHVVKPMYKLLGLETRFSELQIQTACGILDTNCYEIKWDRGLARGLYEKVAYLNHDCVPNCRKYFDSQRTMHVLAATTIEEGHEMFLSYVSPLFSTPMRQAILLQTKGFHCLCKRCKDPEELGSPLGGIKCKNKSANCPGSAYPSQPLELDSDLICNLCQNVISCDTAKMMQDTAMNLINGKAENPKDAIEILNNLERFLPQGNHIMVDLKLRIIDQVIEDQSLRGTFEDIAINFCFELLNMARNIAPGTSKLRGVLSMKFHQLTERGPHPLVVSKSYLDAMFAEDQSVLLLD